MPVNLYRPENLDDETVKRIKSTIDKHDAYNPKGSSQRSFLGTIFIFFFKNSIRTAIFFIMIGLLTAVGIKKDWADATSKFFTALVVGDLLEAGKVASNLDISSRSQDFKDIAIETGYIAKGVHPFMKKLETETKEKFWTTDFIYIGNGIAMKKTLVKVKDVLKEKCGNLCEHPATYATYDDAIKTCKEKYKGRLPSYKEISTAFTNPVIRIRMTGLKEFAEWTSDYNPTEEDDYQIYYHNAKMVLGKIGRPKYLDNGELFEKLGFRCIYDVKIAPIDEQ